ncbi:phage tail protein [Flavobacteriaceae bacterium]|nr:phage tail protein [Flavobacteriaceae bacterium]
MAFVSGVPSPGTGGEQDQYWPMPKFYFSVDIGDDTDISFQEVSGLNIETDVVEYRHGNSPTHSVIKMPGLMKYQDIELKRGVFADDHTFYELISQIKLNTYTRVAVQIRLLDELDAPRVTWDLLNAFVSKITPTDLNSQTSDAGIESMTIVHEGLTIS